MPNNGFFLPTDNFSSGGFSINSETVTPEQQAEVARNVNSYGLPAVIGGAAVFGTLVDLPDTILSSVGLINRGDLTEGTLSAIDSPGLMNFYNQNRGAIEVGSGVVGIIASDFTAGRFLRPAGATMRYLSGTRLGSKIATLDQRYQRSLRAFQMAAQTTASRGGIGAAQYVGEVPLNMLGVRTTASLAGTRRGVRWANIARGGARNVTTEAIMTAMLNQNAFLFSEDMSENILWMGAGLGLGAFIDRTMAVYAMRRAVNSDVNNRLFAHALDPTGVESSRLRASLMEFDAEGQGVNLSHLGYLQGHYTDRATSYMVTARTLANTDATDLKDLAANRERFGDQNIELGQNEAQKATTHGISGIPNSGFSTATPGLGNHMNMMMMNDPSALYGIEMLGAAGPRTTLSAIHETRAANITARQEHVRQILNDGGVMRTRQTTENGKKVKKQVLVPLTEEQATAYRAEFRQLVFHQSLTAQVSLGREWVPLQVGRLLDSFEEPKIRFERTDERTAWTVEEREVGDTIGMSNDGEVFLPTGKTVNDLDFFDQLRLYRVGQTALESMVQAKEGFILNAKADWFQLDFAEQLIKQTGDESLVSFPAGMTRQTAQVESLRQKTNAIRLNHRKALEDPEQMHKLRMQYNLPTLTAYESGLMTTVDHPIDVILRGATEKSLENVTYGELMAGIREVRNINGLMQGAKDKLENLSGDMFKFMVDDQGHPIQAILGYRRPLNPHQWTRDDLAERLAMRKALTRDIATGQGAGELTSTLIRTLLDEPDYAIATQIQGLQDIQLMSFMPGFATAAPQSARGNLLQSVVSREWLGRDVPTLLAAARIRDKGERITRAAMQVKVEKALGDVVSRVNGPRNFQTRHLLNQYLSFRPGWDLTDNLVPVNLPNGKSAFQFGLNQKSLLNQQRWQTQFGEAMPTDATLRTPQGITVVVDDLGREFLERYKQLSADILTEKNTILRSQGLGKINSQAWYAPPPNSKGKYIGFTLDAERNPVPGGTIIASTPEEFARMKSRLENDAQSPLNRNGHMFYTQDALHDFATIWDKAQMNFIDPGTTAVQPGKRGEGKSIGWEVNPNAFEDALTWARDEYLRHGDNVMRILFNDAIHGAEARAQIAKSVNRNESRLDADSQRSIYDHYVNTITGRLGVTTQASAVGRGYRLVEEKVDRLLAESAPHARTAGSRIKYPVHAIWRAANEWLGREIGDSAASRATFNKLTEALGDYMPFKNAAEMAEKQMGAKRPPELAEITGTMSRFEAAMRLRIFEVIHPIMNLSGIVNAMPSVIRHVQRLKGETMADYSRRIGHSAQIFGDETRAIGVLDMAKIGYKALKRTWNRAEDPRWQYRVNHGYMTQEVAEFHRQFGAINSRGTFKRFVFGAVNPNVRHSDNPVIAAIEKKGIVGHLSTLSDRSEDFSRSWGHMTGIELAEMLGIRGIEAQESFAHDIANKMIANYDPKNRPEIFQGALGAPIGLFQSFIWNYYQRLFRYIETGDGRAFATQYAMQGSLFGTSSLPGFSAINKFFFDHSDGDNDPYDSIFERFGQETGDVLMGGVLSNLPKIANMLPGEQGIPGIDLYSRGDTNVRLPVYNNPPFVDTAKRVWAGFWDGVAAFAGRNPNLTDNQLAEIASNVLTNRPIAGFIEQAFADGYDTDRYGQVAAEANGAMESVYRVMGVRSMRQSKELDAFYANRNQQEQQGALMSDLRESVRSAMRAGEYESIPSYFERYVANGGDPTRFRRWIRDNFEAATTTRAERQLEDVINNPDDMALIERLLDAQVQIDESELNENAYQVEEPETDLNPAMPAGFEDPMQSGAILDQFEQGAIPPGRF